MDLRHTFTVGVDIATAWETFEDISSVAECFPGAVVTKADGDDFEGTCKVKLGPIALQYSGSGTFVERDAEAHRMVLRAQGRDKRGNGTAGATVTASFTEQGPQATDVEVVTDLQVTGKPAQFGRGVMQDVSDKLLGQFVLCLQSKVAAPETVAAAVEADTGSQDAGIPVATPDEAGSVLAPDPPPAGAPTAAAPPPPRNASGQDALDLGATVLPVLVRAYGRQAAAGLVSLLVLRWLVRAVRAR